MAPKKRRVVVTGLGPVTSVGVGKKSFWHSLVTGNKKFSKVTRFDPAVLGLRTMIASEIDCFNPHDYVSRKEAERMDRFTQYAVAAALLAFEDANLSSKQLDPLRFATIVGTAIGGAESYEKAAKALINKGKRYVSPAIIPMVLPGLVASQISMMLGAQGVNQVISTSCTSANNAIGSALRAIQFGDADVVLAGGSDACINEWAFVGFCLAQAMSTRNNDPHEASRPFDKKRDGFVMGEGAGIIVLEELEHAKARKANIYAELVGYGATADAYHVTAPRPDGSISAQAMKKAVADAGIETKDISYINAHGTSTKFNDLYETMAIKKAFGRYAKKIPISSTKSMIGHSQGACGGIEAIASVLSIKNDIVHPTVNYTDPDPECDLDYVPNQAREHQVNYALSNSCGFGGNNAAIVFKKYKKN